MLCQQTGEDSVRTHWGTGAGVALWSTLALTWIIHTTPLSALWQRLDSLLLCSSATQIRFLLLMKSWQIVNKYFHVTAVCCYEHWDMTASLVSVVISGHCCWPVSRQVVTTHPGLKLTTHSQLHQVKHHQCWQRSSPLLHHGCLPSHWSARPLMITWSLLGMITLTAGWIFKWPGTGWRWRDCGYWLYGL